MCLSEIEIRNWRGTSIKQKPLRSHSDAKEGVSKVSKWPVKLLS